MRLFRSLFVVILLSCGLLAGESSAQARYAGWETLALKLKSDGVPDSLLRSVYNGKVVPAFEFVPFSVKPRETHDMYAGFISKRIFDLGKVCGDAYARELKNAEVVFHVDKEVLLAIIVVESHCGRMTGKELVVNRLSRVVNTIDPRNTVRNFEKLRREDASVTLKAVRDRAVYLERVFYPQLKALFEEHLKGNLDLFSLRGSIAGAFGWPQFLPLTYAKFGVDGDRDGHVSLFDPADAVFSAAHFLAAHGWKPGISESEQRKIIWHYNKSEPYIDTVLRLKSEFER